MTHERLEMLRNTTFGSRTAEDEVDGLATYFVETDAWRRLVAGDVDVVYGPKGSGKSALYVLLLANEGDLFNQGVLLVPAENPRGATAFGDLAADPPTDEAEFRHLWQIYFAVLIGETLAAYELKDKDSQELLDILTTEGLLAKERSFKAKLSASRQYIERFFRPQSVEGTVRLDPAIMTGKIVPGEATSSQRALGAIGTDELFEFANPLIASSWNANMVSTR
jgi:hypothetical protein